MLILKVEVFFPFPKVKTQSAYWFWYYPLAEITAVIKPSLHISLLSKARERPNDLLKCPAGIRHVKLGGHFCSITQLTGPQRYSSCQGTVVYRRCLWAPGAFTHGLLVLCVALPAHCGPATPGLGLILCFSMVHLNCFQGGQNTNSKQQRTSWPKTKRKMFYLFVIISLRRLTQ